MIGRDSHSAPSLIPDPPTLTPFCREPTPIFWREKTQRDAFYSEKGNCSKMVLSIFLRKEIAQNKKRPSNSPKIIPAISPKELISFTKLRLLEAILFIPWNGDAFKIEIPSMMTPILPSMILFISKRRIKANKFPSLSERKIPSRLKRKWLIHHKNGKPSMQKKHNDLCWLSRLWLLPERLHYTEMKEVSIFKWM